MVWPQTLSPEHKEHWSAPHEAGRVLLSFKTLCRHDLPQIAPDLDLGIRMGEGEAGEALNVEAVQAKLGDWIIFPGVDDSPEGVSGFSG